MVFRTAMTTSLQVGSDQLSPLARGTSQEIMRIGIVMVNMSVRALYVISIMTVFVFPLDTSRAQTLLCFRHTAQFALITPLCEALGEA